MLQDGAFPGAPEGEWAGSPGRLPLPGGCEREDLQCPVQDHQRSLHQRDPGRQLFLRQGAAGGGQRGHEEGGGGQKSGCDVEEIVDAVGCWMWSMLQSL